MCKIIFTSSKQHTNEIMMITLTITIRNKFNKRSIKPVQIKTQKHI